MGSGEETRARWGAGGGGGEGAGGGVGTHWQPLNTLQTPRKCEPGLCSGEETRARAGVAMGVVRARGGCGHALAAFKYSLNTQKMQPGVGSGEGGGVVWVVGVVRARGGCGHAFGSL